MFTYLIDDDPISLFLTEQMLRLGGFQAPILSFTEAAVALTYLLPRLATALPQVILLDVNMPRMNGWQFLDALTPYSSVLQGRCQLYLLTSSLALADTARARSYALISGIIHKPLDAEQVRTILAQRNDFSGHPLSGPAPAAEDGTSPE